MSKNVAVFVDVANLYYSARGQEVDVDYVALLKHATKGRDLIRAYAYSGLDPENENQRKFIDFLGKNSYKVIVKDIRKFGDGRVKANLDIELVVDLFRLADRMDIAVIVSGDGDFAPAIRALQDKGVRCEVISFRPNTSGDLIAVADEFIDIMKIAGIGRKKDEKGAPPTPEMPAKEVVPEFGFREAPPAVAAAALAALKGREANGARSAEGRPGDGAEAGEDGKRRRRRRGGRGRKRTEGAAPAEAAARAPDGAEPGWQELDDLSQVEGLEDLGPEIGEGHEYRFEEADEETLRELGLLDAAAAEVPSAAGAVVITPDGGQPPAPETVGEPPDVATAATPGTPASQAEVEPPAVETPTPRRRGGRPRTTPEASALEAGAAQPAESEAPAEERAAAEGEKKPRRRTTRAAGARTGRASGATAAASESAEPAAPPTEAEVAEPKATRARSGNRSRARTRRSGDSGGADAGSAGSRKDDAGGADGETAEGIWQRFRSARQRPKTS